eukprot:scaffold4.g4600.t1
MSRLESLWWEVAIAGPPPGLAALAPTLKDLHAGFCFHAPVWEAAVSALTGLRCFGCESAQAPLLPQDFGFLSALTDLEALSLSGRCIPGLPPSIAALAALTRLHIAACNDDGTVVTPWSLEAALSTLTALRSLALRGLQHRSLPRWRLLACMPELRELDLGTNSRLFLDEADVSLHLPALAALTRLVLNCHSTVAVGAVQWMAFARRCPAVELVHEPNSDDNYEMVEWGGVGAGGHPPRRTPHGECVTALLSPTADCCCCCRLMQVF